MTRFNIRLQISIRTMLVVVTLTALVLSWWQTVPSRTAAKFAHAIAERNADAVAALFPSRDILRETWRLDDKAVSQYKLKNGPRSIRDVLYGRSSFEIIFHDYDGRTIDALNVHVVRYKVENAFSAMPIFSGMMIARFRVPIESTNKILDRRGGPRFY